MARITFRVPVEDKKQFRLLCFEAATDMQAVLGEYVASYITRRRQSSSSSGPKKTVRGS
jgi:hypothetical protein